MFRNTTIQRSIATIVLTTFMSLSLYPLTAAAQAKDAIEKAGLLPKQKDEGFIGNAKRYINKLAGDSKNASPSSDDQLGQLLAEIHEQLKAVVPDVALPKEAQRGAGHRAPPSDIEIDDRVKNIRTKTAKIKGLYADIDQGFKDTEQRLKDAKLPQVILDRHNTAVAQYQGRKAEFERLTGKVEQATDGNDKAGRQTALVELGSFMAKYPNAKPHQYGDPTKLPFKIADAKVRAPYTTKSEYQVSLFPPRYKKVMLAGAIPDGLQLAQATLPEVPNAPDLAQTDDVQITQAIKDQAAALNNSPVKIYNWVRNNIAFVPSYGSIQGSDMTLQNRRGNAFDTASLLIAMYRAAGVPARYVYGTIDVPADRAMNWVGGVTKPEAAQSLLGQGGIPNIGITSGGAIKTIRMEHVWVEAFVDYGPGMGAINKSPNTWVPMDASFKQYQFAQGMDIKSNVPLDSQNLLTQIQQGATVDTTQGYVQNLNQANLQTQLTTYQSQVKTYIDGQKANATVGDVLGSQTIVQENYSIMMGTLPYKVVATGNAFQTLPDNLRWKFKTNIYPADGISDGSSPIIELNQSTAKLAGKKITLSFVPATQADQDLVNSYLPKPHTDGTPIQPSELPSSLPGYLLHMKAEIRVDGQVIAQTAESFTMGGDVKQSTQYFNPAYGTWEGGEDNDITVGEYNAIGIDLQGMGAQQLKSLQARMDATRAKLMQFQQNPGDATPINGLTKEDLTGDLVQTGILSYFAQVDTSDNLIARTAGNLKTYRLPSYGRFLIAAQPHYFFGVVRNVSFQGVTMDVDYLRYHVAANDGSQATSAQFMRQAGSPGSFAENAVPEAMFRDPNLALNDSSQPQGVSAVKALAIAAAQGQRIYTLNENNQSQQSAILQSLQIDQDVKMEIANALAVGREVTVHEKNINVNGWVGNGYIVLDAATGAGAYKISGGMNGGQMSAIGSAITTAILGLGVFASLLPFGLILAVLAGPVIALAITIILVWSVVLMELQMDMLEQGNTRALIANLAWGAFGIAIGALTGSLWVALAAWIIGAIGNVFISLVDETNWEYRFA